MHTSYGAYTYALTDGSGGDQPGDGWITLTPTTGVLTIDHSAQTVLPPTAYTKYSLDGTKFGDTAP